MWKERGGAYRIEEAMSVSGYVAAVKIIYND